MPTPTTACDPGRGAEDPRRSLVGPAWPGPRAASSARPAAREFLRWEGQCRSCAAWNTLVETVVDRARSGTRPGGPRGARRAEPVPLSAPGEAPSARFSTGIGELDRVLGGGIVPGSLLLIGGEPGVGKSTLLLQVAGGRCGARRCRACSTRPARSRRRRSGCAPRGSGSRAGRRGCRPGARDERGRCDRRGGTASRPALVVVDSIQTMTVDELDGPAGSVGQVRESALRLMELAKGEGIAVVLVGHVTKDGSIAGPADAGAPRRRGDRPRRRARRRDAARRGRRRTASGRPTSWASSRWASPGSARSPTRAGLPRGARGRRAGQRRRRHAGGQPAAARRGPGARLARRLRHPGAPGAPASTRRGSRSCSPCSAGAPAWDSGATTSTRISPAA